MHEGMDQPMVATWPPAPMAAQNQCPVHNAHINDNHHQHDGHAAMERETSYSGAWTGEQTKVVGNQ